MKPAPAAPGRLSLAVRLGAFYGGFFLFLGLFFPYWPVWLRERGFGAGDIGVLVALTQVMKAATSPFIAQLSDASGKRRELLLLASVLATFSFALFLLVDGYLGILLVAVVAHLFIPALLPLNEQLTLAAMRSHGVHYGRTRSVGSLTFVAGAIGGGAVIAAYGTGALIWSGIIALGVTAVAAYSLPATKLPPPGPRRHRRSLRPGIKPMVALLRDPAFALVMVVVALLQASHGVYYVVGTLYWQSLGFDLRVIGALWALGVIAEILIFIFLGRWVAARPVWLVFAVVGAAGTLRWGVMGFTGELAVFALLQCLHGLTYGATHLATMDYLARTVPDHRAALAQALYSALPMGLAIGAVLALSGVLYDVVGGHAYLAMAAMTTLAAILAFRLRVMEPGAK